MVDMRKVYLQNACQQLSFTKTLSAHSRPSASKQARVEDKMAYWVSLTNSETPSIPRTEIWRLAGHPGTISRAPCALDGRTAVDGEAHVDEVGRENDGEQGPAAERGFPRHSRSRYFLSCADQFRITLIG